MSFATGALVATRGREWVVLPGSTDELLLLRPLGGGDADVTGIVTALEEVGPATFDLPSPEDLGDERAGRLLRDALVLGFRSSAGPFRCFGRLAFEPRAYQLVPLLMALRLDPVRLLVADDVGTGKTASALLVAAELMAQGDVERLAVLCPPHLASQWQAEMRDKFALEAELVLPATASRLERGCRVDETLFEHHPITVVSSDFIKSDRRREEFQRSAPELVIVDEAHTAVRGVGAGRGRHQRHELVAGLADSPDRHLILVTATPHSGNEDAFRSLLTLLDPSFADLPDDLSGDQNQSARRRLARHFVQRRRIDLRRFLDDTPFPERLTREETYELTPEYRRLFDRALAYSSEVVTKQPPPGQPLPGFAEEPELARGTRVRWWSVLALLRSLASSPAAAALTLRTRAATVDVESLEEIESIGHRAVMDLVYEEDTEGDDSGLGADVETAGDDTPVRRRLLEMARQAELLLGDGDPKLARLTRILQDLLGKGSHPIVFCRFIATAEYVAEQLRQRLGGTEVAAVTGAIPASERPTRVAELATCPNRVLVATDCLSEGINLQSDFDAVVHYDLSWNPTRHEQREGRVDRLGQPRDEVRVVTLYGADNRIDQLVLEVLLRKHAAIRSSTGVSVPVPGDPGEIVEALVEGLFAAGSSLAHQQAFDLEGMGPHQLALLDAWDRTSERERRSRTVFAQESIRADAVRREVDDARAAVGTPEVVEHFVMDAVRASGGVIEGGDDGSLTLSLLDVPQAIRDAAGGQATIQAHLGGSVAPPKVRTLTRSDPFVAGLAGYVFDSALDVHGSGPARRAGVIRTGAVNALTTLLLVRYRFDLQRTRSRDGSGRRPRQVLVEDAEVLSFTGQPTEPVWCDQTEAERLLHATASSNVAPEIARTFVEKVLVAAPEWSEHLASAARARGETLLTSHRRVREAVGQAAASWQMTPLLPPDVLGVYVLVPVPQATT